MVLGVNVNHRNDPGDGGAPGASPNDIPPPPLESQPAKTARAPFAPPGRMCTVAHTRPAVTAPPDGLIPVRTAMACCHVLVAGGRAVIIDTGLLGGRRAWRRCFREHHLDRRGVDAIILTHGHLDHAGNAAWLQAWTRAPIVAHPAEQAHIDGCYPYRGAARFCGWLERLGRAVTRYRPVKIDRPMRDGDLLPWWGGLRVVHLPGHSAGHCGLWSERHRLLFCGDLVAIWPWRSCFPPFFFNTEQTKLRPSLRRAAGLRPQRVVPNHYLPWGRFDPAWLARRFAAFARRQAARTA